MTTAEQWLLEGLPTDCGQDSKSNQFCSSTEYQPTQNLLQNHSNGHLLRFTEQPISLRHDYNTSDISSSSWITFFANRMWWVPRVTFLVNTYFETMITLKESICLRGFSWQESNERAWTVTVVVKDTWEWKKLGIYPWWIFDLNEMSSLSLLLFSPLQLSSLQDIYQLIPCLEFCLQFMPLPLFS